MKNKIIIVFLFFVVMFALYSLSAQAYYDPAYPGSITNPLQIQIVPDPSQVYLQTIRDQQLKMYQQNQENYQNQLLQQQRDLQNQLLQQRLDSSHNQPLLIPIKSNDQMCSDKFGQSWKWDGSRSSTGVLNCGCKDGYTRNNGECVIAPVVPVMTNDQICNDTFVLNSIWNGTKNDKGGLVCDCKTGYHWNSGGTACIVNSETFPPGCISSIGYSLTSGISCDDTNTCGAGSQLNSDKTKCVPIPKTETKIKASIIKKVPEIKADTTNTTNLTTPTTSDTKVAPSTEPVKPKSLLRKVFGWLGF